MARRKKGARVDGWIVLDKALELTSTDAVAKVRRVFGAQKAGHAGTLDPLATGILPIALGEATKTVAWLMEADKSYRFTVRWGTSTDSQDREGRVIATSDVRPTVEAATEALKAFVGEIDQVPPIYSAIKVDGERAYDLARDGETVELAARKVVLHEARVVEAPDVDHLTIECRSGKGFYVRALARDLAAALGADGHVSALRRTAVGPFHADAAITLEKLEEMCLEARAFESLKPVETALDDIPAVAVTDDEAFRLRQGRGIFLLPHLVDSLRAKRRPRLVSGVDMSRAALATHQGLAVAIGDVRAGRFDPVRVFQLGDQALSDPS
ncbi:MAG: tRNA pseudouridine(55) synthase TruB [Hyphomonadaceae bacterium]|nr:tRNA pseudouridine(55) synthase TruB [Hyphomonadaceae bacterium]